MTNSGSGVVIPTDFVSSSGVDPDADLVVNVVQLKTNSTNKISFSEEDVMSITIDELIDNGEDKRLQLDNLSTNFTILLAG